jgi:hypothetical protein
MAITITPRAGHGRRRPVLGGVLAGEDESERAGMTRAAHTAAAGLEIGFASKLSFAKRFRRQGVSSENWTGCYDLRHRRPRGSPSPLPEAHLLPQGFRQLRIRVCPDCSGIGTP